MQGENKEKRQRRILSTLSQGKPLYAHVNIDVIGCCKQCQMVTRVQPGVADDDLFSLGEGRIFWRVAGA